MRILLTGGSGQLGGELVRALAGLGSVAAPSREELDLARPESVRRAVRALRPALVVNAAAYTDVERAEDDGDLAMAVNGVAPGVLAEEAAAVGAGIVHFSTDYVFDGTKPDPYTEEDPPAPCNVYGETKLRGEEAVRGAGAAYLIFRVSWLYGLRRRNFLISMIGLFRRRREVTVVDDQIGTPTWCRSVAGAAAEILERLGPGGGGAIGEASGVYHLAASGSTSWYGFAEAILERLRRPNQGRSLEVRRLRPIPSSAYPTRARRPPNSALSSGRAAETFGVAIPRWDIDLDSCMAELDAARQPAPLNSA